METLCLTQPNREKILIIILSGGENNSRGVVMFYMLLSLLHEDLESRRIDLATYVENVIILAEDYEKISISAEASTV